MPGFLPRGSPVRLYVVLACLLSLWNVVSSIKGGAKKENGMTFLPAAVSENKEVKKEKERAFLAATELPARSVDLSTLNLTELVNGMLSRALKDGKKSFSLLSITSYSSFAFHKFSVAIYNVSSVKSVDPAKFPTRYCYCLNNRTNDLSDFTALLVEIIGNSTSYLTEIFKSTSILSARQTNASDCTFVCVMAGKAGRNLSDFWEMAEKSPVVNDTFTSSMSSALATRTEAGTPGVTASGSWALTTGERRPGRPPWGAPLSTLTPPGAEAATDTSGLPGAPARTEAPPGRPGLPSPPSGTDTPGTQTPRPTKAVAPRYPQTGDLPAVWLSTAREEPALVPGRQQLSPSQLLCRHSWYIEPFTCNLRCPEQGQACILQAETSKKRLNSPWHGLCLLGCPPLLLHWGPPTAPSLVLAAQKLNPCLMELCRFFQQCLCVSQQGSPWAAAPRYCLEYFSWFLKNATYICQRLNRVSHAHTLKQKCLENICKSV